MLPTARRSLAAPAAACAAVALARRALHFSAALAARKRQAQAGDASTGNAAMDRMLADMDTDNFKTYRGDGMSTYQMKMVTEAVLVRSYLEKVHTELPQLQAAFQPAPYTPPAKRAYLRFRYVDHPGDPTNPMARKVALEVKLAEVTAAEALTSAQRHMLLLVAGPRYDPVEGTIRMAADRFPHRAQNKAFLADTFAELLRTVKETKAEDYSDVPVDLRHAAKKLRKVERKRQLQFPKEWPVRQPPKAKVAAGAPAPTSS